MDDLLGSEAVQSVLVDYPRARVVRALRASLEEARSGGHLPDTAEEAADPALWARAARDRLRVADRPSLRSAVNATGVVLHTNLGRAPLAAEARAAFHDATTGYANLEFDLDEGVRGSRYHHCAGLLTELTRAEDALVVNNCAAALMLALNTLARGAGVVVSRGELVEIGGGFRIPDILERSGARLMEVGSTNRTRPEDYAAALGPEAAAVLKVHRSNFRIRGFTEEATLEELAPLARDAGRPLVFDLGSGLLADPAALGLPPEPRPQDAVSAGAELVVFSGDKLLGGPQAGLVVGRRELIDRLRNNPMCRALRVDKGTLAALEATLRLYRDPEGACRAIPVLRMLQTPVAELQARADELLERWRAAGVADARGAPGMGAVGGGTYPDVELESWTVRLGAGATRDRGGAEGVARALRESETAVVGRIEEGEVVLDLRTVPPDQDAAVAAAVEAVLAAR